MRYEKTRDVITLSPMLGLLTRQIFHAEEWPIQARKGHKWSSRELRAILKRAIISSKLGYYVMSIGIVDYVVY